MHSVLSFLPRQRTRSYSCPDKGADNHGSPTYLLALLSSPGFRSGSVLAGRGGTGNADLTHSNRSSASASPSRQVCSRSHSASAQSATPAAPSSCGYAVSASSRDYGEAKDLSLSGEATLPEFPFLRMLNGVGVVDELVLMTIPVTRRTSRHCARSPSLRIGQRGISSVD